MEEKIERPSMMCRYSDDIPEGQFLHIKAKVNDLMEKYDGEVELVMPQLIKQKYLSTLTIIHHDPKFESIESDVYEHRSDGWSYIDYIKLSVFIESSEDPYFLAEVHFTISHR